MLFLLLFLTLAGKAVNAQILTPIPQQENRATGSPAAFNPRIESVQRLAETSLPLPFIDDFSKSEGNPDPSRWETGSGVFTSNRFAAQPLTIGAATFDGLQANGEPYSQVRNTFGATDTLTSKPIALGNLQPQDSVYLSFYWQAGGLLGAPGFSGNGLVYLQLEFKQANGTWDIVWKERGTGRKTDFAPVMLALKETNYLHDGFQFRWVSSGRMDGQFDAWHLDYVHLNKNRRKGQLTSLDVALTKSLPSLLRRYTAMPIWQFKQNPMGETKEQVGAELMNLSPFPAAVGWSGNIQNLETGEQTSFLNQSGVVSSQARRTFAGTPPAALLGAQNSGTSFKTTVYLTTQEPNAQTLFNDTVTRVTHLQDFYAYDDGTPEIGLSFPSNSQVQVAYQFEVNAPDRLRKVRLYFTGGTSNTPGTVLHLLLWADDNGKPATTPLLEQRFTVPAAAQLNDWLEITLDRDIPVQSKFYVGYRQPAAAPFVNVGLDYDGTSNGKLFWTNGGSAWTAVTDVDGAWMVRPVMGGIITSAPSEMAEASVFFYPNPATDFITVAQAFDRVELYVMTGKRVEVWQQVRAGAQLALAHLAAGMYLAKAFKGNQIRTAKLIIQR
ncbi:T9SS type A sorting domain-containing protein [Rufibacter sp. LB8]|nr:T9SS type A sorting domain-containing protein [Rufibacter sp. LB8]